MGLRKNPSYPNLAARVALTNSSTATALIPTATPKSTEFLISFQIIYTLLKLLVPIQLHNPNPKPMRILPRRNTHYLALMHSTHKLTIT
jgi:hypothetical protein